MSVNTLDKAPFRVNALTAVGVFITFCVVAQLFRTYWRLRHIPGPLFAKITNLQRLIWVKSGRAHEIHQDLHDKHGDFVRFGPNMVSICDPAAIPTVYPMRPGFPKSDFYRVLMPYTKGGGALPAVFNTRDEKLHKLIKNPIAPLFSQSNVMTYECFVDEVLAVMFDQLTERYASSGEVFDLGNWLQYFAFDVMGTLTFSKRYGLLETGQDVNGMLETIWNYMKRAAPLWEKMTQIPWLDQCWYKNPVVASLLPATGLSILRIVGGFIGERVREAEATGGVEKETTQKDMLSRFMKATATSDSVPKWAVTAWTFSNVIAGSDSTGVVLKTTWYNLLAHPETMKRLLDELLDAEKRGRLSRPFPRWKEVRELPYLDACINEGVRMHPPFCLPLERVVPQGGVTICGRDIPAGTVVGCNPYVTNRHKPTFGEDADAWRPERWLGDERHKKTLEQSVMTFGAGRRVCLGKNLAFLEMKKLVPALLLNYQIDIENPNSFTVENAWFFRQKGLNARIKPRPVVNSRRHI